MSGKCKAHWIDLKASPSWELSNYAWGVKEWNRKTRPGMQRWSWVHLLNPSTEAAPRTAAFNNLTLHLFYLSSVYFSCSVMSDSLQPHGLQHARPPCPSPTPRVSSTSELHKSKITYQLSLNMWVHSNWIYLFLSGGFWGGFFVAYFPQTAS